MSIIDEPKTDDELIAEVALDKILDGVMRDVGEVTDENERV